MGDNGYCVCKRLSSKLGIHQPIQGGNLTVAFEEHIGAGVYGALVTETRAPRQDIAVVLRLCCALGGVGEVRMGRAQVAGELVQRLPAHEEARGT
jgi:hypothetical protein